MKLLINIYDRRSVPRQNGLSIPFSDVGIVRIIKTLIIAEIHSFQRRLYFYGLRSKIDKNIIAFNCIIDGTVQLPCVNKLWKGIKCWSQNIGRAITP